MDRVNATLTALRQILRATELHSRDVARSVGLTAVQLRILKLAHESFEPTAKHLAAQLRVSQATVTALLDKLAVSGMIERRACPTDRRQKTIFVTDAGRDALDQAPDPIQKDFARKYEQLEVWEQTMLLSAAERIASLLDADDIAAAPILSAADIADETSEQ